ncbi:hypothetical protein VTH06DRAFT_6356 [Thermothelomyces fergusii]
MTNQGGPSGSSLIQARSTRHDHDYSHQHQQQHHHHPPNYNLGRNLKHQHLHLHQHRRLQSVEVDPASPHTRSPPGDKLHGRHVIVVQTVSVVQFIDATGAVTNVQTLTADPAESPRSVLPGAASSVLGEIGDVLPSVSLTDLLPDLTDGTPSETSSSSLLASSETLTSTPLTTSSAFPTLSVPHNSSSIHVSSLFRNHTTSLYLNSSRTSSTLRSVFASTTTSSSSSSHGSSSLWTSTSSVAAATAEVGGAGADFDAGGEGPGSSPDPADSTSKSRPSGLPPETRNAVVGGVVGSVAGIALIVLALLFLLKRRKRRGQGIMLLGDGDHFRGRGFSSPEPGSPGGGKSMVQRAGAFSIPSALARLSGKRAIEERSAESTPQEKGFYRVSGRKLISVLESGGDGYSDPHDSIGGSSSHYRDSHGTLLDSPNPFQLGSPMRPVSGVPIFRNGAQRTPVHEQGPFPPGHHPSVFSATSSRSDSAGRGFARGSRSRFTEEA